VDKIWQISFAFQYSTYFLNVRVTNANCRAKEIRKQYPNTTVLLFLQLVTQNTLMLGLNLKHELKIVNVSYNTHLVKSNEIVWDLR